MRKCLLTCQILIEPLLMQLYFSLELRLAMLHVSAQVSCFSLALFGMPLSRIGAAPRAFVAVLLLLARRYQLL